MDHSQQQNDESLKTITIPESNSISQAEAIKNLQKLVIDFHTSIQRTFTPIMKDVDQYAIQHIVSINRNSKNLYHHAKVLNEDYREHIISIAITSQGKVLSLQNGSLIPITAEPEGIHASEILKKIRQILEIEEGNCIYSQEDVTDIISQCWCLYTFITQLEMAVKILLSTQMIVNIRIQTISYLLLEECEALRSNLCLYIINEMEQRAKYGDDHADKDLT